MGGCAACLSLLRAGLHVILTEPTDWLGGQISQQLVPPDEHPWIESCGATATYRAFRKKIRKAVQSDPRLTDSARQNVLINPGQGWVSRLCFEPKLAADVLKTMLETAAQNGRLEILTGHVPIAAETDHDVVRSVTFQDLDSGATTTVHARYVLDATELGDLLPLTSAEYRIGAESKAQTGEDHAVDGEPEPENVQGITWCFAMGYDPNGSHIIEKPKNYDFWRTYEPAGWSGKLLSWNTLHAHTGEFFTWTLFPHEHPRNMGLFDYRQVVSQSNWREPVEDATIVNWPQNDYYLRPTLDIGESELERCYAEAKELSLSLLYWLQTEAPRPDGGEGYAGLRLRPDLSGTEDGFAKHPYIRESRRMETKFTVLEQHVAAHNLPGQNLAPPFWDSVGVGAYRIDLHPSANGRPTVDFSSLPFTIPLGALIPVRMKNLLPACKNLGVTHITNGCYRLHPVEWNIGEAAGALAAYCLDHSLSPDQVYESKDRVADFQRGLLAMGIELYWPEFRPL